MQALPEQEVVDELKGRVAPAALGGEASLEVETGFGLAGDRALKVPLRCSGPGHSWHTVCWMRWFVGRASGSPPPVNPRSTSSGGLLFRPLDRDRVTQPLGPSRVPPNLAQTSPVRHATASWLTA